MLYSTLPNSIRFYLLPKKRPQNLNNMQLHYYLLLSKMFICEETRNIIYSIRFYVAYRLCYKVSFNPHKIKEQERI